MRINLIADRSVSSAPAGFTAAVQNAANVFDEDIPGNYTVNITYGWGTFDNAPNTELTPSDRNVFSLGGINDEYEFSYGDVKGLLTASATTSAQIAAVATLPSASPFATDQFLLSGAQEKALGVFNGGGSAVDGSIGFNTDDASNGVLSSFTQEGAMAEIAHALGFFSGLGTSDGAYALDLYRYASPSVRYSDSSQPSYFSVDGGTTDLANYDTSGFDPTLFVNLTHDPLSLDTDNDGAQATLTSLDIEALDAMGFAGTSNVFGTVIDGVTSPSGQIDALYQTILDRPADSGGLQSYAAQAASGTSVTSIAQSMLSSPEYANDYGSSVQSNSAFVSQLYLDGLHRQPDPGGLATYDSALASGVSRAQVAVDIATSPESQNDLASLFQPDLLIPSDTDTAIVQLYYGLLDREPDRTGLADWEVYVAQGGSISNVASDFIGSSEYAALHGPQTDSQFVDSLYEGALGREPDAGGAATYLNALSGGASRASVALDIAESPEANAHLAPIIQGIHNIA